MSEKHPPDVPLPRMKFLRQNGNLDSIFALTAAYDANSSVPSLVLPECGFHLKLQYQGVRESPKGILNFFLVCASSNHRISFL